MVENRVTQASYYSDALETNIPYALVLPEGEAPIGGWPVLFLLHGRGRNHLSLVEDERCLDVLSNRPYLIVLPNGFDGWYVNSPIDENARYADALVELEVEVAQSGLSTDNRNGRAIAGWSMGGFGALYQAVSRPDRFSFAGSIIGLLDFPRSPDLPDGQNYEVPEKTFGSNPDVWERINPRTRVASLKNTRVYLVIGEAAFDRSMNENFLSESLAAGLDIESERLRHGHTFDAVRDGLPLILDAAQEHFQVAGNRLPELRSNE